jgi:hypothetical protein
MLRNGSSRVAKTLVILSEAKDLLLACDTIKLNIFPVTTPAGGPFNRALCD